MYSFECDAWVAIVDIERHRDYNFSGEEFVCKYNK